MALTQIPLSTLAGTSGTPVSDTNKLIDDDDNRMDDAREPLAHATTHASGGSDPVTPISIGAATSAQGALADSAVQPAGTPASNQLAYWTTAQILAASTVTTTELESLTGIEGNVQDQLAAEASARSSGDALALKIASNLSDLDSAATARDNLGLGDSATKDVGTTAGSVAAGDDARIVAGGTALQPTGDGSGLSGITALQVGAVPNDVFDQLFEPSLNLLDLNDPDLALGRYVASSHGNTAPSASNYASGFVPVEPLETYRISYNNQGAWYDKDRVYISGWSFAGNVVTAPANAAFLRATFNLYYISNDYIVKGSSALSPYEPFGTRIKSSYLARETLPRELIEANVFQAIEGKEKLRGFKRGISTLASGGSAQVKLFIIGDSYSQSATLYVGKLAKKLQDMYGMAALGYISFSWFGAASGTWTAESQPAGLDRTARYDLVSTFQIIGTWTCSYHGASYSVSGSNVVSNTAGDYIRFNITENHTAAVLHYSGDGTGVIAVSWDDGSTWSDNIDLDTVNYGNVSLPDVPLTAGICRIKVVSGNVGLCGVDMQSEEDGIVVHKTASAGAMASSWYTINTTAWSSAIVALGADTVLFMFGANEQANAVHPTLYRFYINSLFSKINTALPYADKLVIVPPENNRTTNAYAMASLSSTIRTYAAQNDAAFMDLQGYFGSPENYGFLYSDASDRKWFSSDLIHPSPTGGLVIADAIYDLLT